MFFKIANRLAFGFVLVLMGACTSARCKSADGPPIFWLRFDSGGMMPLAREVRLSRNGRLALVTGTGVPHCVSLSAADVEKIARTLCETDWRAVRRWVDADQYGDWPRLVVGSDCVVGKVRLIKERMAPEVMSFLKLLDNVLRKGFGKEYDGFILDHTEVRHSAVDGR